MLIENQEVLKSWLTTKLEPLCDADPAALAKYVIALVKKDKPESELKDSMIEQLDVFLQQETKNFVELLFKTLESKAYLEFTETKPVVALKVEPQLLIPDSSTSIPTAVNTSAPVVHPVCPPSQSNSVPVQVKKEEAKKDEITGNVRQIRKADSDKDEKSRRNRHRSPSPKARSRSHSWDRSRRSRSRDRDRVREKNRGWEERRKRSPGSRRYERDGRERRKSWSRSKSPRNRMTSRSRSRTPRHRARNYRSRSRSPRPLSRSRSRSPHCERSRSRSRSHSRSRSDERARDGKKEPMSGAGTPTQDSNHGDVDMRLNTTSQSIQSVIVNASSDNSSNMFQVKRRCRDFDERGFCMRGDLCPYDHGTDPVVLEDVPLAQVLSYGPTSVPPSQPPPVLEVPNMPPRMISPGPPQMTRNRPPMRGPVSSNMEPYNPDAPSMEPRIPWGNRGPGGINQGDIRTVIPRQSPYSQPQRELINVPVADESQRYDFKFNMEDGGYGKKEVLHELPKRKMGFDYSRLGPRKNNLNNCSLVLKKVPSGLNNITHLNEHFSKFGKIVNIQVCFEGDPEAAIITFSSHAEANAAYRSTEAVLNNRFIKVFWHNKRNNEGKQENVPPSRPSVKERLGIQHSTKVLNTVQPKVPSQENQKVIMSGNTITKTVYIPTALKKTEAAAQENNKSQAVAAIKKSQEILAAKETLKKKQEAKRKEAIKLTADLRKRKQDLLEKQLQQQKVLIEKLEKNRTALKESERDSIMATIKCLQESIENIKKDMSGVNQTPTKKTKEEAQKEILDAELDLITRQQEGGDTSELQKKVTELKMEACSLGLLTSARGARARGRGRGRARGRTRTMFSTRGRGAFSLGVRTSVDHRPTKVLVSGYENDEKLDVLAHFAQYGVIVDYIADDSTPSIVLNFKTRKEAEVSMIQGRNFRDRTLTVTWYISDNPGVLLPRIPSRSGEAEEQSCDDTLVEEEEEEVTLGEIGEDILLQDDEEEEEDGEDRSWRR